MKVVLDTNVLLAAFASHGLCEVVLEMCLTSHDMFLSQHILSELHCQLERKLKMPPEQAGDNVTFLSQQATLVEPSAVPVSACRDPDDLLVLGTALAAGADCLVTGDKDLLDIGEFRRVLILSPRQFHDKVA